MKKLAIGCGLVVLVTCVAAAAAAYYVFRQVSSAVTQLAELSQAPELERGIRNRSVFVAPPSGELSDAQVEKLVRVQSEVRARLGARIAEFEAKYRTLAAKESATVADAPAVLRAYSDMAAAWLDAKRGQVEALNAAGLSLDEYRWIREQAYRALGQPFVDLDIAKLVEDAKRGIAPESSGRLGGAIEPSGPPVNRTRIERFKRQLEDNLALASFGL